MEISKELEIQVLRAMVKAIIRKEGVNVANSKSSKRMLGSVVASLNDVSDRKFSTSEVGAVLVPLIEEVLEDFVVELKSITK